MPVSLRVLPFLILFAFAACFIATPVRAQDGVAAPGATDGAQIVSSKTIIDNLTESIDHTHLVEALRATAIDDKLGDPGPFTVFAPLNSAFDKLPRGGAELLQPENKIKLTQIMNYHIVPGLLTAGTIEKMAQSGNGKAILRTVEGDTLTVEKKDGVWVLEDTSHNVAQISGGDVTQSNGILFVIDTVMIPKS